MSLLTRLIPPRRQSKSFTPASDVNWTRIETLVHGPGASDQWEIGGDTNSAVFACLMTLCTAYPEPPPRVVQMASDGKTTPLIKSPLTALLNKPTPNGELSLDELRFWTAWAKHTDGNAYWVMVRSGNALTGNVVELWPVSPEVMKPYTAVGRDGRATDWITEYRMQVAPNKWESVPLQNVIHFKLGLDPKDMRMGLSPLKRLARLVSSDEEADKFANSLLKNFAIPGLVVIPGQGETIDKDTADRISSAMSDRFSGEGRGKTAVISRHGDVKQFGFSPKDMDLSTLHRIPEERIAAVIGVPAILAGLGAGLDRATLANAGQLREYFTEQTLVPLWRADAARLNVSLTPNFHSDPNTMLEFDVSNVRALQEDEDKKYTRLNLGVQGTRQWIAINEARADVGLPPADGHDDLEEAAPAPAPIPPADNRPDNEDGNKQMPIPARKANDAASRLKLVNARRVVRAQVAGKMETAIDGFFADLANDVIAQLSRLDPVVSQRSMPMPANGNGHGTATATAMSVAVKVLTRTEWNEVISQLFGHQAGELDNLVKSYVLEVIELTWPYLNLELSSTANFSQNDPAVVAALREAGSHIKGILETTRVSVADYLKEAYRDGRPIEEMGKQVRQLVKETYKGRGEAIARTEVGMGQNTATTSRYKTAGVKHVEVFDNGFDNSHEFCRVVAGKTVTVEWMQRNPLQHPRCVRAFGAVFDYEGDVFTQEVPWT